MEKAVVDLLQPEHLRKAAASWNAEGAEPKLISAVENFVYDFPAPGRDLILRLTHSSHRTAGLVKGELDWIHYLHENGANVCRPIQSVRDQLVEVIPAGDTCFIATVFERARGIRASAGDPEVWNAGLFRSWGRTIGRMHALTTRYAVPDPAIKRPEWHDEDLIVNARHYLPASEADALAALEECVAWLRALPQEPDSYGLIHTDVHQANFHLHEGTITVFDFDDCTYHWFVFDLAIPLYYSLLRVPRDEVSKREQLAQELFTHLMEGYEEEHHLGPFWIRQIPGFLRFRDLQLYVFCFKKFDMSDLQEGQARFFNLLKANMREGISWFPRDLNEWARNGDATG
jgi:Ser/Thr protein kinase RdoA (MazF antagonist)